MTQTKVTSNELALGAATSLVITDQTTTSTTYADLTTVGPSVTVIIGSSGNALVSMGAGIYSTAAVKKVAIAISGATTRSPSTDGNTLRKDDAPFTSKYSLTYLETGLNPGSTTFTMKYQIGSGTGNFFDRTLTVVPL